MIRVAKNELAVRRVIARSKKTGHLSKGLVLWNRR